MHCEELFSGFIFEMLFVLMTSWLITQMILPRLSNIASKIGLMDHPEMRKMHDEPKPLVGGIGIVTGVAISSLLFVPLMNFRGFYAGIVLLLIAGFLDDFKELDHKWKFIVQIVAVGLMIHFSNAVIYSFGDLVSYGPITFKRLGLFVTVFAAIGVINSINMIDGLDGLAGGVSLIAFLSFALLALIDNNPALVLLSFAFCGALVAFLAYNWSPASLFMGDAGSISLGFALTFVAITITQGEASNIPPVAPLLILAVPIVDTLTVMLRRMLKGKSAFEPDTSHIHHILLRLGISKERAVLMILGINLIFSAIAVAGVMMGIPEHYMFTIFVLYFVAYFITSFYRKRIIKYRMSNGIVSKT
ncbi:MAG: undecaprenyl/decaprenyl-phosphate alpha-N-acetylglucosaminyl 1-phosphate transferase [Nitrospirota bacterium]|nr:MAG: undecaprenyl/decaprenyl-phosphate alpha-N-acetylglucosaminyl 1-phosphate transferase [Nitrospirota bacterium]